jgi:hypothetical protein
VSQPQSPPALIQDGYTLHHKAKAVPGLCAAYEFAYRWAGDDEIEDYRTTFAGRSAKKDELILKYVARLIYDGVPLALSRETVPRLNPLVKTDLAHHVLMFEAPSEGQDVTLDAAAREKNSPPG